MKSLLSILSKTFASSCILFFIFPSMIKSQDIYVSSKSIFTQTTHIINVDDEYKYNSGPGRGVSAIAKIKLGLGLETGFQVENKGDDNTILWYGTIPIKLLVYKKYKKFSFDAGGGIFRSISFTKGYSNYKGLVLSFNIQYLINSKISFFSEVEYYRGKNSIKSTSGSAQGSQPGGGASSLSINSKSIGIGVAYKLTK